MIDWDDVSDVGLFSIAGGSGFLVALIIMLIFSYFAFDNQKECEAKSCPVGMQVKLQNHACQCVMEAK